MANGATASDEESGRLELVLSQPVRRGAVFVGRAVASVGWLVVIGIAILVAQLLSDAIFDLEIDAGLLAATVALTTLIGIFHASVALLVAGFAARPGLVLAIGLPLAILGYLVSALFPLSGVLEPYRVVSPWDWALAGDPLANPTDPWRYLSLLIPSIALIAIGTWLFDRRDVGAA